MNLVSNAMAMGLQFLAWASAKKYVSISLMT